MMAEAFAKKEIAQKKLAVCYFSLMMDLEMEQHQHTAYQKWVFVQIQKITIPFAMFSLGCIDTFWVPMQETEKLC